MARGDLSVGPGTVIGGRGNLSVGPGPVIGAPRRIAKTFLWPKILNSIKDNTFLL